VDIPLDKELTMSEFLAVAILVPVAFVVATVFSVLWRERTSQHEARTALASGIALTAWALSVSVLAYRGLFRPRSAASFPPIGINLAVVLVTLAVTLAVSGSLRGLLARQSSLIRLHVWRVEGIVFLILMLLRQMPPLWAIPAGMGDILVGTTALWVARDVDTVHGRRRAILWNLLGMLDLIVAVALGVMTNPGPAQIFHTTPTSELVTYFPLALVPTFLVPLAFTLHVVSLWQLLGGTWARR
jgi:hypothetical protein